MQGFLGPQRGVVQTAVERDQLRHVLSHRVQERSGLLGVDHHRTVNPTGSLRGRPVDPVERVMVE
jgi:hypothetical protein